MSFSVSKGLQGPGDLRIEGGGGSLLGGSGGGGAAPQWSVGAPHVFAIAGMQRAFENLSDAIDQQTVTDVMLETQQRFAADYDDPDTGQFNTRKGAASKGMLQEYRDNSRKYWDEDLSKRLNERQRAQIAAPMAQLMLGQAQKIAAFEANNQYQDAVQRSELAEYNAVNLAASGGVHGLDDLAPFRAGVEDSVDLQARLGGWDAEYTAMRKENALGTMYLKAIDARADQSPIEGLGMLRMLQEEIPSAVYRAKEKELAHKSMSALAMENPTQGLAMVEGALSARQRTGNALSFVAGKESNNDPAAIGYDSNGGTSYGKYQIASKPGTMDGFISWLGKNGKGDVADKLLAAGPADSDGKGGAMADAWRSLVASGELTEEDQDRFIQETHVDPVLDKLTAAQRDMFDSSPGLESALYSAAVQHGPAGALAIINRAWSKSGNDTERFTREFYADRATQFGSSDEKTRAAVQARFKREQEEILGMEGGPGGSPEGLGLTGVFSQAELAKYHKVFTEAEKEQRKMANDKAAASAFAGIMEEVQSQPPKIQDMMAAASIDAMPPGDVQSKVRKDWEAQKKIRDEAINTKDAALVSGFLRLAKEHGGNYGAALGQIDDLRKQGLSEAGAQELRARIEKGEIDTVTYENSAAANEGYQLIDLGGITGAQQIETFAFNKNLTFEQVKGLKEYLASGGQQGTRVGLWSKVDNAYKTLTGKSGEKAGLKSHPDFFESFMRSADMDKLHREGEAYIRRHAANMLMDGDSVGGGFLWGDKGETYSDAVNKGRGESWLPDVTDEEREAIAVMLRNQGVRVTDARIRQFKKHEIMKIPGGR